MRNVSEIVSTFLTTFGQDAAAQASAITARLEKLKELKDYNDIIQQQ